VQKYYHSLVTEDHILQVVQEEVETEEAEEYPDVVRDLLSTHSVCLRM
jgi:hypothetical protein